MSSGEETVSRFRIIALDLLFMAINFSALTLFSSLKDVISADYGFSSSELEWAAIAYSMGIFFAFLIGHSRFFEERPKITVLFAGLCAAIPQLLIPLIPNALAVAALRFLQGLVMSAVPIFSYQGGKLFPEFRTLAIGTILSGMFIG
ncbi:MAG: MFS transporter, partial [Thaumarchaeota archaeon]